MRLIILLTVVALAGLATASGRSSGGGCGGSCGGGRSSNGFGGVLSRLSIGGSSGGYNSGGQIYGHANGPYGLYYSFLDPRLRHHEFTWHQADYQCRIRGMQLVSLDNYFKDHIVSQLIHHFGVRWIWTSGLRYGYQFVWGNGSPVGLYYSNWSPTGSKGYPQPDNAEGNEYCLAVLNHHYHDGIVWHDIGCNHRKSFVCEYYYH